MPRVGEAFRQQAREIREVDFGRGEQRGGYRNNEGRAMDMGQTEEKAGHGGAKHKRQSNW